MKKIVCKLVAIIAIFLAISLIVSPHIAAEVTDVPADCSEPGQYEPDFDCINRKIIDPSSNCLENKCKEGFGTQTDTQSPEEFQTLLSFFGTDFSIRSGKQIPFLINFVISTILGGMSVYAVIRGVYIGAFVRANATDEETIQKTNKELMALIIGFVLAWTFIIIIQFVASILGLGSLNDLVLIGGNSGTVITIN